MRTEVMDSVGYRFLMPMLLIASIHYSGLGLQSYGRDSLE